MSTACLSDNVDYIVNKFDHVQVRTRFNQFEIVRGCTERAGALGLGSRTQTDTTENKTFATPLTDSNNNMICDHKMDYLFDLESSNLVERLLNIPH